MSSAYSDFARGDLVLPRQLSLPNFSSTYFAVCCAVIGLISFYDTLLVFVHRDTIFQMEQNPICLMLLQMEPVCFSLFVLAKAAGTLTVLAVLLMLFRRQLRSSLPVTTGIALFQLGLLTYLTFG